MPIRQKPLEKILPKFRYVTEVIKFLQSHLPLLSDVDAQEWYLKIGKIVSGPSASSVSREKEMPNDCNFLEIMLHSETDYQHFPKFKTKEIDANSTKTKFCNFFQKEECFRRNCIFSHIRPEKGEKGHLHVFWTYRGAR